MLPSLLPLWLLACAGPADDTAADDTSGADTAADDTAADDTAADDTAADDTAADASELRLTEDNGLIATIRLELGSVEVTGGADIQFQWDDLATDLRGDPIDAGSLSLARFIQLPHLTPGEARARIIAGDLLQEDLGYEYGIELAGEGSVNLSELDPIRNAMPPVDAFATGSGTWLFLLMTMNRPGAVAMAAVVPSADQELGAKVDMDTVPSSVEVGGTFGLATGAPSPALPSAIDWTALEHTASGSTWAEWQVDALQVARYDTTDLDAIATGLVRGDPPPPDSWMSMVDGTGRLEDLSALGGPTAFTGFTATGTWLITLQCGVCWLPIPRYAGLVTLTE
jgi:hypothetical protein